MAGETPCRRCVECIGQDHHWLTSMPEMYREGIGGGAYVPCKHCEARAGLCEECFEGAVWPPVPGGLCDLCNAGVSD